MQIILDATHLPAWVKGHDCNGFAPGSLKWICLWMRLWSKEGKPTRNSSLALWETTSHFPFPYCLSMWHPWWMQSGKPTDHTFLVKKCYSLPNDKHGQMGVLFVVGWVTEKNLKSLAWIQNIYRGEIWVCNLGLSIGESLFCPLNCHLEGIPHFLTNPHIRPNIYI